VKRLLFLAAAALGLALPRRVAQGKALPEGSRREGQSPGPVPSVALLALLLKGEWAEGRRLAARHLGRFGALAETATPGLQQALRDEDPHVRNAAGVALSGVGSATRGEGQPKHASPPECAAPALLGP
jgi:HEAT repeat protein